MSAEPFRKPDHDIEPVFLNRWSPRAFRPDALDSKTLYSLFEAARWAPSGNNSQPWRFLYARKDALGWDALFGALNANNKRWAGEASVLILVLSKKSHGRDGEVKPLRNHSFDAGAAWASLAFQAHYLGLSTHAIGGFDRDAVRAAFAIPEDFHIEVLIAVGRQAARETLHPDFHDREKPSGRRPVDELAAEGAFTFSD